MQQIVITLADDGQITVAVDGQEPYVCASSDECLAYLEQLMGGGGESAEEAGEGEADMAMMWNEEAARRQPMGM